MKKTYIAPKMETVEFNGDSVMQTASLDITTTKLEEDSQVGAKQNAFDLWGEDEE